MGTIFHLCLYSAENYNFTLKISIPRLYFNQHFPQMARDAVIILILFLFKEKKKKIVQQTDE